MQVARPLQGFAGVTSALLRAAGGRAAQAGPDGVDCAAACRHGRTAHPRPACGRLGVELIGPGPGRDVIDRHGFLMGGDSPSPKATVYGPTGHNRCTPGPRPGLRRGRTRSGARYPASVFCAGVLCGSCIAPRSPCGPPEGRLSGGASSSLAEQHNRPPTRARWPGLMNAPSIDSVSAAAGALRRL